MREITRARETKRDRERETKRDRERDKERDHHHAVSFLSEKYEERARGVARRTDRLADRQTDRYRQI